MGHEDDRTERTLLIEQAAAILGLSRRTVYYRIHEGRLQTIRTRCGSQRVTLGSIERLLAEIQARSRAKASARRAAAGERRHRRLRAARQARLAPAPPPAATADVSTPPASSEAETLALQIEPFA
jgi:excisionase family DNA binding protein